LGTFQQGSQFYWIAITDPIGIDQAINTWQGRSPANIPAGNLVCQQAAWNCGWSWHEDPATVRVAETAVEICDGGPPASQAACQSFSQNSAGRFCPWSARLVELRDCRTDAACPMMPK